MKTNQIDLSRRGLLAVAGAAAATLGAGCGGASATTATAAAATTPLARLFSTEVGAGKNLMLLHGWTCDSHDWSWQLPVLESKYRVVAVDLRGHGRSEAMPSGAYMPSDYVADIESLISTRYAGQKFILMGHSMGGQVAARLAAQRPDVVSAVISVDGSLGFPEAFGSVLQQGVSALQTGDLSIVGPAQFDSLYDASTAAAFKRWHARRLQGMSPQAVRESVGPLFLGPGQVGVGVASETFCRSLTLPFYHLCRTPDQAAAMRPWFSNPKSKVEFWANTGHWIQQDQPDALNAAVTTWIDAL